MFSHQMSTLTSIGVPCSYSRSEEKVKKKGVYATLDDDDDDDAAALNINGWRKCQEMEMIVRLMDFKSLSSPSSFLGRRDAWLHWGCQCPIPSFALLSV